MTITPRVLTLTVGETANLVVFDLAEGDVITVVSDDTDIATAVYLDGNITVAGLAPGSVILTITNLNGGIPDVQTVPLTVIELGSLTPLTEAGSGEGNDTTVIGRQYIINLNLQVLQQYDALLTAKISNLQTLLVILQSVTLAGVAADVWATLSGINRILTEIQNLQINIRKRINTVDYGS